ncbi:hypothetical protein ERX37_08845 [Macrococcus hajekii]|uniref:Uncharacterized protein n=1 Tax=Macrococcus hajekii TaxID=198482 RepID=A0A4R6BJA1_9STAP|nr:hypothetical protein [Macrococcus hajekii]TDM01591.1 hypothetical protein ERX37_08845 [Macrococcus hajekii]GGB01294.1 hypothetical protein GCM10007190_06700 [Macrococcus hajekii]
MSQLCDCSHLTHINVSADYGADPLWCAACHLNLDAESFTLSDSLDDDLFRWSNRYGQWLDLETNTLIPEGAALETKHNEEGLFLTKRLQHELPAYLFTFIPSIDTK